MASWLVCLTPDRAVWAQVLAGTSMLFSWERHFTLTVSIQEYKSGPRSLMLREAEIFLVLSCNKNRDKLRPDGPLVSCADITYHLIYGDHSSKVQQL